MKMQMDDAHIEGKCHQVIFSYLQSLPAEKFLRVLSSLTSDEPDAHEEPLPVHYRLEVLVQNELKESLADESSGDCTDGSSSSSEEIESDVDDQDLSSASVGLPKRFIIERQKKIRQQVGSPLQDLSGVDFLFNHRSENQVSNAATEDPPGDAASCNDFSGPSSNDSTTPSGYSDTTLNPIPASSRISSTGQTSCQVLPSRRTKHPSKPVDSLNPKLLFSPADQLYHCGFPGCQTTRAKVHAIVEHRRIHDCPFVCRVCSKRFATASHLARHEASHSDVATLLLFCARCALGFKDRSHLTRHIERQNCRFAPQASKTFACDWPGCVAVRTSKPMLYRHKNVHTGKYQCRECLRCCECASDLRKHKCLAKEEEIKRPRCVSKVQFGRELEKKSVDPKEITRNKGSKSVSRNRDLNVKPEPVPKPAATSFIPSTLDCSFAGLVAPATASDGSAYPCTWPGCSLVKPSLDALVRHMNVHKRWYVCRVCSTSFESAYLLRTHKCVKKSQPNVLVQHLCAACAVVFCSKRLLRKHLASAHAPISNTAPVLSAASQAYGSDAKVENRSMKDDRRLHFCAVCAARFEFKKQLRRHLQFGHYNGSQHGKSNCQEWHRCDWPGCSVLRKRRKGINQHRHVHLKTFCCPVCARCFERRGDLEIHRHFHATLAGKRTSKFIGRKRWRKGVVLKSQANAGTFPAVMKLPPGIEAEPCASAVSNSASGHPQRVSLPKGHHFACDWPGCNVVRLSKTALRHHRTVHLATHRCVVCSRCFETPFALQRHKASHRPPAKRQLTYRCDVCSRCFETQSERQLHKASHRSPSTRFRITFVGGGFGAGFVSAATSFACAECGAEFLRQSELNRHVIAAAHLPPAARLTCERCKRTFISKGSRAFHERKVHGLYKKPLQPKVDGRTGPAPSALQKLSGAFRANTVQSKVDGQSDAGSSSHRERNRGVQTKPLQSTVDGQTGFGLSSQPKRSDAVRTKATQPKFDGRSVPGPGSSQERSDGVRTDPLPDAAGALEVGAVTPQLRIGQIVRKPSTSAGHLRDNRLKPASVRKPGDCFMPLELVCQYCSDGFVYQTRRSLMQHRRRVHNIFETLIKTPNFRTSSTAFRRRIVSSSSRSILKQARDLPTNRNAGSSAAASKMQVESKVDGMKKPVAVHPEDSEKRTKWFACDVCKISFRRADELKRHKIVKHVCVRFNFKRSAKTT